MNFIEQKITQQGYYFIAEIGLNHNGSVELAKKLIDVAVIAGADAVKFQKRSVELLAISSVLDAKDERFPQFGKTYREIRECLEFNNEQYQEIIRYTESKAIDFMCTPFDINAVDFLDKLGISSFKIASHSLTNLPLLHYIAEKGKPVILSTGMCETDEIDEAVRIFSIRNCPLILLHCISAYPTPADECNLSIIPYLKKRYGLTIGYSGHEIGYLPTLISIAMGAEIIERHITLDHSMTGFDHKISLEPDEIFRLIREIRLVKKIIGKSNKKISATEMITRDKYHVSMVSIRNIPKGTILTQEMVTYRNPGTGIPPKSAGKVIGKRVRCDILEGVLLEFDMIE